MDLYIHLQIMDAWLFLTLKQVLQAIQQRFPEPYRRLFAQ